MNDMPTASIHNSADSLRSDGAGLMWSAGLPDYDNSGIRVRLCVHEIIARLSPVSR